MYKKGKGWVWISVIGVIGLAGLALLFSAPWLFSNHDNRASDTSQIKDKFPGFNHSDDDWTGFWSPGTFPGSVGDTAMNLPDTDLRLEIYSAKGHLTGMIAADQICLSKPFTAFLLFDGEANGDTATITTYDFNGGQRNDLVKVKLARDETAMTVVPVEGNVEWLPKMTRVERDLKSDWVERDNFRDFCTPERHAALRQHFGKNELTDEEKIRVLLK